MSATQTKNRREWVKNAAIIFLSVLLVLTFFSGTIQNYSLPEVAVQYTMQDTVSSGIRVSGTVNTAKSYSVVTEETRTVAEVLVRNGDEVAAGDVLVRLEDKESDELTAARDQLKALQADYDRALLGQTGGDTTAETAAVAAAETEYHKAVKNLNNHDASAATLLEKQAVEAARQKADTLKNWKAGAAGADMNAAFGFAFPGVDPTAYDSLFDAVTRDKINPDGTPVYKIDSTTNDKIPVVDADGQPVLDGNGQPVYEIEQETVILREYQYLKAENKAAYDLAIATANAELSDAQWKLDTSRQTYADQVTAAQQAWDAAKRALAAKQAAITSEGKLDALDLQEKKDAIAKQQALISELMLKSGEIEITAKQAGTVGGLIAVAGEKLTAGDTVCTIQLTDTGYTVDVSLTAAQAQRVTVGSSATVSGYYWGEVPRATVTSIRNDPNTRGNRLVTLTVTGSVETGSSYNFILAETSSSYDVVVPKIAVREDNTGAFVLVVTNKSTPLGTRYYVTRVDVTVLASDDTRCAVSGEFTGWDYVVTSSSAPISAGDQVRLADA